ncbi:hypothetical protein [Streptomyces sp. URMC 123]|uniref:hypothetical protein n=1 Tax=Streptomyces sp. URMC 123 TaxID=3423403 RepID=UPI003F1A3C36
MEAALIILVLFFVACVALGVYATVKAVGAAKRGVDRTVAQARRAVEDTTLKAKQYAQPGPAGEIAQLRLSLRTSMRATQEALRAGVAEDASLSESIHLFERLSAHGREMDDELKRLEREPNRAKVAERLPELRERIERITHSADSLRWAARDRARRFADDDLAVLGEQIEMETGALRHWAPVSEPLAEPAAPQAPSAGGTGTGVPAASAGSAGAASGAASGGAGAPGAGEAAGQPRADGVDAQPRAITAANAWQRATGPWQKVRRPESTT